MGIQRMGTNHDGKVTFDEFKNAMLLDGRFAWKSDVEVARRASCTLIDVSRAQQAPSVRSALGISIPSLWPYRFSPAAPLASSRGRLSVCAGCAACVIARPLVVVLVVVLKKQK